MKKKTFCNDEEKFKKISVLISHIYKNAKNDKRKNKKFEDEKFIGYNEKKKVRVALNLIHP